MSARGGSGYAVNVTGAAVNVNETRKGGRWLRSLKSLPVTSVACRWTWSRRRSTRRRVLDEISLHAGVNDSNIFQCLNLDSWNAIFDDLLLKKITTAVVLCRFRWNWNRSIALAELYISCFGSKEIRLLVRPPLIFKVRHSLLVQITKWVICSLKK
jgi:hypothetical protein